MEIIPDLYRDVTVQCAVGDEHEKVVLDDSTARMVNYYSLIAEAVVHPDASVMCSPLHGPTDLPPAASAPRVRHPLAVTAPHAHAREHQQRVVQIVVE